MNGKKNNKGLSTMSNLCKKIWLKMYNIKTN